MEQTISQCVFFSVAQGLSRTPLYDAYIEIHWSIPTIVTLQNMSAVCFLYGKYLYQTLRIPIGLIDAAWDGTLIEYWSSPDVLRECGIANSRITPSSIGMVANKVSWYNVLNTFDNLEGESQIWNAMIHPLLNMSIYGVIWYQGESNYNVNRDKYNCTFHAMIHDWRNKWYDGSQGHTDPIFPFGFVQLGPNCCPGAPVFAGFTNIRWHQTFDIGYVPNNKMINTFMCVTIDLFDTVAGIHFRDKMSVAKRLSLSGLAIAYGKTGYRYQGPIPTLLILDTAASTLNIIFDNGKYSLILKNSIGLFEICCRPDQVSCDVDAGSTVWTVTPAKQVDNSTVSVSVKACNGKNVMGLRYLWRESPCIYKQAPIYATEGDLPAGPFLYQGYMGYYSAPAVKHTRHYFYIKH